LPSSPTTILPGMVSRFVRSPAFPILVIVVLAFIASRFA
jgi:hypothetical protein